MTRKNSRNVFNVIVTSLVLIALGLTTPLGVQADISYIDYFTAAPFSGNPTSFTTGSAATGLSYVCSGGDGCSFGHATFAGEGNSPRIDVASLAFNTGTTETVTITSRDGQAFSFVSMWIDNNGGGAAITITGYGPEPFTINVPASTGGMTYSPSGGNKLVTRVELTSADFWSVLIDTVSTWLDVPGMDVQGNSITIANGDSTPATADGTDLGSTSIGLPITQDFNIRSIGDDPLDLTGSPYVSISGSTDLTISVQPTTDPIASGNSDSFTVRCNPSGTGARTATVSIGNDSEANPYTFSVQCTGTAPAYDSDGDLTASATVVEPVALPSTANTTGTALDIFDFYIVDGGSSDGLALDVSHIVLHTSGTGDFSKVTWRLNGPDASNVTGTYSGGANTITFTGLSISVADGNSETYTINAFYNDNTGLTDGQTYILSVDGDTDLTVGASGTHMGTTTPVNNGTGSPVDITATALVFATQPSDTQTGTAISSFTVEARDAAGNLDSSDSSTAVTLSFYTNPGGSSISGTNPRTVSSGVATFNDISLDQDGIGYVFDADGGGLTTGTSSSFDIIDPEPTNHPTGFGATADSASQITTAWTDSTGATLPDGYLVLCNLTGTFTPPGDGTPQGDDASCADGSGVMNVAQGTGTYLWTGLDSDTQYFFTIFPYTNSGANIDYKTDGTPPTDDATTFKDEPTNHPTGFSATADSASQITTAWTDSTGGTLPDGYLVLCNLTGTFTPPSDIAPQSDDTDCSDGSGVMNVAQGAGTYSWTGLDSNTQYYFTIFPYTNSGTSIDYKTDGTPPTDDATTLAPNLQVSKSNSAAGAVTMGDTWEWRLVTTNSGSASADFGSGQTILSDQLPTTNVGYGAVTVDNQTGVSGSISCSINGSGLLSCTANGGTVSIDASTGTFRARFTATPSATGTFTNPTGGSCSVDPNDNISESDETDNACNSDSVTVNQASTTTTITSDAPDPSVVGQSYTVSATVTSGGGIPTGSVDVDDGEGNTCTITLASGAGNCSLASTSAGAKTLTANYGGDANFVASSDTEAHAVNTADTTTSITSDKPDPSAVGQAVTVVYSVAADAPGGGTLTGDVTVSDGVDNCVGTVAEGSCNISLSTTGARTLTASYAGDSNYNASVSPGEPHDVDAVGIIIAPVNLTISEPGGSDVFSATLTNAPADGVSFDLTLSNGQCDVTPPSVALGSGNWDSGVEVTVSAVDDDVADGDQTCVVQTGAASSSDGNYNGLDPADVTVTVQDDDVPGLTIVPSGGSINVVEGGATDSYEVVLLSEPTVGVTISADPDGQLDLGAGGDNPVDLTFTALNWATPQTITVAAVDDALVEGLHSGTITHTTSSGDSLYDGVTLPIVANITDNEQVFFYLPLALVNHMVAPDLMITSLIVTSDNVQVTIENQGNDPISDEFWVDVYIDPRSTPVVNQPWSFVADEGLVWGISTDTLDGLAPGHSLALTLNDAFFQPEWSQVSWPLDVGTTVYAQVDSYGEHAFGAVRENHEVTGGAYNNVSNTLSTPSVSRHLPNRR